MKDHKHTAPLVVLLASGLLAQFEAAQTAGRAAARPGWLSRITNALKGARA